MLCYTLWERQYEKESSVVYLIVHIEKFNKIKWEIKEYLEKILSLF